jgi:hypothetical protein
MAQIDEKIYIYDLILDYRLPLTHPRAILECAPLNPTTYGFHTELIWIRNSHGPMNPMTTSR